MWKRKTITAKAIKKKSQYSTLLILFGNVKATLVIFFKANTQSWPGKIGIAGSQVYLLSQVLFIAIVFQLNQPFFKNEFIIVLKKMIRLIELTTDQKAKYEDKLLLNIHFYYSHWMIQQFLQTQLKTEPTTQSKHLLRVVNLFGNKDTKRRNIVWWKN